MEPRGHIEHSTNLHALAGRALDLHATAQRVTDSPVVGAIPILFFGDSQRYADSPVRIITVGLNPSDAEFPGATLARFPLAAERLDGDTATYLRSLDGYFRTRAYEWFGSFEPILRGLGASYRDGAAATALHTDLCSPLATRPTWTELTPPRLQANLIAEGSPLWHDLIVALEPDVVLISVRRAYLELVRFARADGADARLSLVDKKDGTKRRRPYNVDAVWRRLSANKKALFVSGEAAQTPFGTLATSQKELLGRWVGDLLSIAAP